jgi:hypothetical protein
MSISIPWSTAQRLTNWSTAPGLATLSPYFFCLVMHWPRYGLLDAETKALILRCQEKLKHFCRESSNRKVQCAKYQSKTGILVTAVPFSRSSSPFGSSTTRSWTLASKSLLIKAKQLRPKNFTMYDTLGRRSSLAAEDQGQEGWRTSIQAGMAMAELAAKQLRPNNFKMYDTLGQVYKQETRLGKC